MLSAHFSFFTLSPQPLKTFGKIIDSSTEFLTALKDFLFSELLWDRLVKVDYTVQLNLPKTLTYNQLTPP